MGDLNNSQSEQNYYYSFVSEKVQEIKSQSDELIEFIGEKEQADVESNQIVYEKINDAITELEDCKKYIEYAPITEE